MNRKKQRRKNQNAGFTLVELVVAVGVLTVIMTPLMRAFVFASNTLYRSASYGESTKTMVNTLELVNASSIYSIDDLDSLKEQLEKLPVYNGETLDIKDMSEDSFTSPTAMNTSEYTDVYNGVKVENVLTGITDHNTEGKVEVFVTAIDATAKEGAMASNTAYDSVNVSEFASYTNMDMTLMQPGLYVDDDGDVDVVKSSHVDFIAETELMAKLGVSSVGSMTNITRTIELNILEPTSNATGYDAVEYEVIYKYSATANGQTKTYDNTLFAGLSFLGQDGIFSVQLVYLPMYTGTETFVINNKDNFETKLFLIKQDVIGYQKPFGSGESDVATYANDTAYKAKVTLNETTTSSSHALALYTNINKFINTALNQSTTNLAGPFYFQYNTTSQIDLATQLLVDEFKGGRGFNVYVRIYEKDYSGNYQLVADQTIVKLN